MISSAKLSYLRISSRKVRLVADLIRGKKVEEAENILNFTRKKAAEPILKLLDQAVANASDKGLDIDKSKVYISEILVNEGPSFKRVFPRARGRADIIQKRTSHISLSLDSEKKVKKRKPAKKTKKSAVKKEEPDKKEETKEEKKEIRRERKRGSFDPKQGKPERRGGIKKIFRRKAI